MERLRHHVVIVSLILIGLVWSVPGCDRFGSNRPLPPIASLFLAAWRLHGGRRG